MKNAITMGILVMALGVGQSALAASASVSGKTFSLTGKFTGAGNFNCPGIPAQRVPIQKQKNISATITFNEDGSFVWSGDTLYPFEANGDWSQRGSRIDLDFDNPTTMSYLQKIGEQQASGYANGASGSANISPSKYDFSAKIRGSKLTIKETGGYRIKVSASALGHSASCKFKLSLTRSYTGKSL